MNEFEINKKGHYFLFVVDTNKYAGNFEREMCAYITGQVNESEVGKEEAGEAQSEIPGAVSRIERIIGDVVDDNDDIPVFSPVTIFPNQRVENANNSVAIYFEKLPESDLIDIMKSRANEFASRKDIFIEGFRILEQRKIYRELQKFDCMHPY